MQYNTEMSFKDVDTGALFKFYETGSKEAHVGLKLAEEYRDGAGNLFNAAGLESGSVFYFEATDKVFTP